MVTDADSGTRTAGIFEVCFAAGGPDVTGPIILKSDFTVMLEAVNKGDIDSSRSGGLVDVDDTFARHDTDVKLGSKDVDGIWSVT